MTKTMVYVFQAKYDDSRGWYDCDQYPCSAQGYVDAVAELEHFSTINRNKGWEYRIIHREDRVVVQ